MPRPSDPDLLVLHTLRCIGVADEARVGIASGLGSGVLGRLSRLEESGMVERGPGAFGGWRLTDAGREADREMVVAELNHAGARDDVHRCYETFLDLNPTLLQVCSDWQLSRVGDAPIVNDHADPDYDAAVLERLMNIDDQAQQVCADLGGMLMRFQTYGDRLSSALEKSLAGQTRYVSDDLESYHTVWFQLHEDLLATLGIPRGSEPG